MAQPLIALLHVDCMANDPVDRVTLPAGSGVPHSSPAQAHLSPFSPPETLSAASNQPLTGAGSVMVSAYSWPPTIENPS